MDDDSPYDIQVSRSDRPTGTPSDVQIFEAIALTLAQYDCPAAAISVALVSDPSMAKMNERFLGHQGATDVLSFDLSDSPNERLEGELIVSVDTAERQAHERSHDLGAEVVLYCIHGTLHLLGHDDAEPSGAAKMHRIEDELLTELGWGPVYGGAKST